METINLSTQENEDVEKRRLLIQKTQAELANQSAISIEDRSTVNPIESCIKVLEQGLGPGKEVTINRAPDGLSPEQKNEWVRYQGEVIAKQVGIVSPEFTVEVNTNENILDYCTESLQQSLGLSEEIELPSGGGAKLSQAIDGNLNNATIGFFKQLTASYSNIMKTMKKQDVDESGLSDEPDIRVYDTHTNIVIKNKELLLFRGKIWIQKVVIKVYRYKKPEEWIHFAVKSPDEKTPVTLKILSEEARDKFFSGVRKHCLTFWFNTRINKVQDFVDFYVARLFRDHRYSCEIEYHLSGWHKEAEGSWRYLSGSMPNVKAAMSLPVWNPENAKIGYGHLRGLFYDDCGKIIPQMLLIYVFAHLGFTARLFKEAAIPAQFCLYVYGNTGSFKTTLITQLSGNIFENPKYVDDDGSSYGYGLEADFNSTKAAIGNKIKSRTDSTLLVDDKFPGTDTVVWDAVVRAYGDSRGSMKMNLGNTMIDVAEICGAAFLTGEAPVFRFESDSLRVLHVGISADIVNVNALNCLRDAETSHFKKMYFSHYVSYLMENFNSIVNFIHVNRDEERMRWQKILNLRPGRTVDAATVTFLLLEIIVAANESLGIRDIDMIAADAALQEYFKGIAEKNLAIKPTAIVLKTISEAFNSRNLQLADNVDIFKTDGIFRGYIDASKGFVFVDSVLVRNLVEAKNSLIKYPEVKDLINAGVIMKSVRSVERKDNSGKRIIRPNLLVFRQKVLEEGRTDGDNG